MRTVRPILSVITVLSACLSDYSILLFPFKGDHSERRLSKFENFGNTMKKPNVQEHFPLLSSLETSTLNPTRRQSISRL